MLIIPAVDIKGGRCVRLEQGVMDRETIFSDQPEEMALQWQGKGAQRLHLVDLDGAVSGRAVNKEAIKRVIEVVSIPVEVGGGIRDIETIDEYINRGAAWIVVGTGAYKKPEFVELACKRYPGKLIVAIDSRDSYVSVEGWTEATGTLATDLAKKFEACGVAAIIYTDIERDGMKTGPNIDGIRKFAEAAAVPVIAAGGVGSIKDIEDMAALGDYGVKGIIIGRALYDGSIRLEEALDVVKKGMNV